MSTEKKDSVIVIRLNHNMKGILKRMSKYYDKSMSEIVNDLIVSKNREMIHVCIKKGIDFTKIDE